MRTAARYGALLAAVTFMTLGTAPFPSVAAPESLDRPADQTLLTYPEWFLVFSPEEYARYLEAGRPSSEFPFLAHVGQLWRGYRAVSGALDSSYEPNPGYHAMIWVIGASTTVEYAVKTAWETLVGGVTERLGPPTEEDRVAAGVARDYADFINVRPWYEFDFIAPLERLWRRNPTGPNLIRAWERRYALTTEYAVKAVYGWLIAKATGAAYATPNPRTSMIVDADPGRAGVPGIEVVERLPSGDVVATAPRYAEFTQVAVGLARAGVRFRAIAGNSGPILVTALLPHSRAPDLPEGAHELLREPIATDPATDRVAVTIGVPSLHQLLLALDAAHAPIEHVFDF